MVHTRGREHSATATDIRGKEMTLKIKELMDTGEEGRVRTIGQVDEVVSQSKCQVKWEVFTVLPCQLSHEGDPAEGSVNLHVHFVPAQCLFFCSACHRCTNAFALAQGCHKTELHLTLFVCLSVFICVSVCVTVCVDA